MASQRGLALDSAGENLLFNVTHLLLDVCGTSNPIFPLGPNVLTHIMKTEVSREL